MGMITNFTHLQICLGLIDYLQTREIDPVLYGSLGASLYLGNFKAFSDIDLLVAPTWLGKRWADLQIIMNDRGFQLMDEHEHEFQNGDDLHVAFAEETVLTRDKIMTSLDEIITVGIDGLQLRTLSATTFKQAYLFSEQDGYRKQMRGKKDRDIIALLDDYLTQQAESSAPTVFERDNH